jgi:putative transposase
MTLNRKRTRLSASHYLGRKTCFVTICCDHRRPYMAESRTAQSVEQLLVECAANRSFLLHAYCLMPDHAHVLAQGTDVNSDLLEFIRLFKQHSAFAFRTDTAKQLWEAGFYDYILRPSDRVDDIAAYIWWNPVRKAICQEPKDFPFSGSQTIEWIARSYLGTAWSPPWQEEPEAKERV